MVQYHLCGPDCHECNPVTSVTTQGQGQRGKAKGQEKEGQSWEITDGEDQLQGQRLLLFQRGFPDPGRTAMNMRHIPVLCVALQRSQVSSVGIRCGQSGTLHCSTCLTQTMQQTTLCMLRRLYSYLKANAIKMN